MFNYNSTTGFPVTYYTFYCYPGIRTISLLVSLIISIISVNIQNLIYNKDACI